MRLPSVARIAEAYWDALLGQYAWYREWTGDEWESEVVDPASGWDSPRVEWHRERRARRAGGPPGGDAPLS